MTIRKQKFTEEYLKSHNATKAAKTAGYSNPRVQGQRLAKNDKDVREAICKAIAQSEKAAAYNVGKAVEEIDEIKRIALSNPDRAQCLAALQAVKFKCELLMIARTDEGRDSGYSVTVTIPEEEKA
jgi:ribosomal protein L16 Arg81 hydroxylase